MPAVRISREFWLYLEEIMRRKIFSSKGKLVKDPFREYVSHNRIQMISFFWGFLFYNISFILISNLCYE